MLRTRKRGKIRSKSRKRVSRLTRSRWISRSHRANEETKNRKPRKKWLNKSSRKPSESTFLFLKNSLRTSRDFFFVTSREKGRLMYGSSVSLPWIATVSMIKNKTSSFYLTKGKTANKRTYISNTQACGSDDNRSAHGSQAASAQHVRMMESIIHISKS